MTAKMPKRQSKTRPSECPVTKLSPLGAAGEELSIEAIVNMRQALLQFGVSPRQLQRAFKRAQTIAVPPRVSGPLLRDLRGLTALILAWSRETAYLAPSGKPRVLAIRGSGVTFERLVKRFLPNASVDKAVALAVATAEVVLRPAGRIALTGDILVNISHTSEPLLAHALQQVQQFMRTALANALSRQKGVGKRRIERMGIGVIRNVDFDALVQELRPQADDFLSKADASMELRRPRTAREAAASTAVGVGIYFFEDDDWDRVGIDAAAFINPDAAALVPVPVASKSSLRRGRKAARKK